MADVVEITAEVRERELRLTSIPMMPSGSRNHLRIRVAFDAEWEGTTKTLVAYRDLSKPYHVPLGMDGTALIPHEVLAEQGVAYLGVFGIAGDQRITSTIVRYGVNEGALTEGLQPSDPTPEMWDQLISAVNEVRWAAESAMRDAHTAAQGAQRSEQAAAGSAKQAEGAATRAENAADTATTSARGAETAKTDAQTAQRAAAQSAADAKTAATRAEQAAGNLSTAVTQAQAHAKSAGDSAASAAQAQQGAADAETSARQSAAQAQKSQETATQAATEAGESARQAAGAQTAAQNSATVAGQQANAAATSAQQTQQSQTAASESAISAQASAAEATKRATAAEASAVRAESAATEVEQSAQQIAGAIDKLAIHATANGNPTVIRDGADWQMERLRVYGQSEQVTTTGAQMFDASTRIVGGFINNGAQASNSRYACSDYIPIPDGTSHLYQFGGALNQRGFYGVDKAYLSKPTTNNVIDVPEGAKYIRITSDIDKQDMGNIMLCVGNTAKPYEPYTGGKPAPSPEYPQEIISKTVDEIVVTGKNLLDSSAFNGFSDKGITVIRMPDGGLHYTGTMESDNVDGYLQRNVKLSPGDYVFFSHDAIAPQISFIRNGRRVWMTGEFTLHGDETDMYAYLMVRGSTGQKIDFIAHPQLELGSVSTPYESYHGQTVTLSAPVTLRGVPVPSGGNVTINGQQYVADLITERDGVVGVERNVITANLAVSEMNNTETHPGWKRENIVNKLKNPPPNSICNVFGERSISFNFPVGIIFLSKRDLQQSEWKQKYPDLVFDIWMILAESSFEPLPEQDQRAIRALRTYHGNTVVTAGSHTEVDYIAAPKLYIDGKVNALVTAYMQSIPVTIPQLDEEVVDNEG